MTHVECKDAGGNTYLTKGKVYAVDMTGLSQPGRTRVLNDRGDSVNYDQKLFAPIGHVFPGLPKVLSPVEALDALSIRKPAGETDPTGRSQHEPGAKVDAGKILAAEILGQFPRALAGVAEVGTFGAKKYTMGGWLEVPNGIVRYANAKVRHWLARMRGEKFDADSKLLHLKHEAWNVLAELELTLREEEKA